MSNLPARPVEWEDVCTDMKYSNDDNDGFVHGIEWMNGEEVSDVTWYEDEEVRDAILFMNVLQTTDIGRYALHVAKQQIYGTGNLMTLKEFVERNEEVSE